jgi:hypothetical protein
MVTAALKVLRNGLTRDGILRGLEWLQRDRDRKATFRLEDGSSRERGQAHHGAVYLIKEHTQRRRHILHS